MSSSKNRNTPQEWCLSGFFSLWISESFGYVQVKVFSVTKRGKTLKKQDFKRSTKFQKMHSKSV